MKLLLYYHLKGNVLMYNITKNMIKNIFYLYLNVFFVKVLKRLQTKNIFYQITSKHIFILFK